MLSEPKGNRMGTDNRKRKLVVNNHRRILTVLNTRRSVTETPHQKTMDRLQYNFQRRSALQEHREKIFIYLYLTELKEEMLRLRMGFHTIT